MRLVMINTESDGCTYSCTNTVPFNYDSTEAAIVDLQTMCMDTMKALLAGSDNQTMYFAGHEFDVFAFYEEGKLFLPRILTIDEWFDQESAS